MRPLPLCLSILLGASWILGVSSTARADLIIFSNGVGGAAGISNAVVSDDDRPRFQYDDFTVGSDSVVNVLEWTGAYAFDDTPPANDDFRIEIRAARNNGNPGSILLAESLGNAVSRADSGVDLVGFDAYTYRAEFTAFNLTAGTDYWLSIINNTTGEGDDWFWGSVNGGNSMSSSNGNSFSNFGQTHDFSLIYWTPEPSSALICSFACLGMCWHRRRW